MHPSFFESPVVCQHEHEGQQGSCILKLCGSVQEVAPVDLVERSVVAVLGEAHDAIELSVGVTEASGNLGDLFLKAGLVVFVGCH